MHHYQVDNGGKGIRGQRERDLPLGGGQSITILTMGGGNTGAEGHTSGRGARP